MFKFPVDAPKQRVIKSFELLGFQMLREKEHISMERANHDGSNTPLTMPNHPKLKLLPFVRFVHKPAFLGTISLRRMIKPDGNLYFFKPVPKKT